MPRQIQALLVACVDTLAVFSFICPLSVGCNVTYCNYTSPVVLSFCVILQIGMKMNIFYTLLDSKTKSYFVHQIKQKMMAHGMEGNTMVKWREQPGGKVFYKEKANNREAADL